MQIFWMQAVAFQPPVKDWMEYLHLINLAFFNYFAMVITKTQII